MLTERKIPLGGGKVIIHSYLYYPLWHICIPATSVPSERAFSTGGNIVNAKHSCLLPENTNMLTFLAQNLDYCIVYSY